MQAAELLARMAGDSLIAVVASLAPRSRVPLWFVDRRPPATARSAVRRIAAIVVALRFAPETAGRVAALCRLVVALTRTQLADWALVDGASPL